MSGAGILAKLSCYSTYLYEEVLLLDTVYINALYCLLILAIITSSFPGIVC